MAAPDRCETTNALGKSQGFGQSLKRTAPEIEHAAKKKVRNEASGNQRMKNASDTPDRKSHGEIVFVRSKMFYSRPTYNRKRDIQFGLPHIRMPSPRH
jgi:hypothetical protein